MVGATSSESFSSHACRRHRCIMIMERKDNNRRHQKKRTVQIDEHTEKQVSDAFSKLSDRPTQHYI